MPDQAIGKGRQLAVKFHLCRRERRPSSLRGPHFAYNKSMQKGLFCRWIVLSCFVAASSHAALELEKALPKNEMCVASYRAIFHGIPTKPGSVTAQRKERRVAVHEPDATNFITDVRKILGDDKRQPDAEKRLTLRDTPKDADTVFITDTDYLPTFVGKEGDTEAHKARIRIRFYSIAPKGMSVEEAKLQPGELPRAKIADGEGPFVKLEFKVGTPETDLETGRLIDKEGVVDKPGITLLQSDVDLLTKDSASFREHHRAIAERAKTVTFTPSGKQPRVVNDPAEVEALIARIGVLHEQGWDKSKLLPQTNMAYVREAHRVYFANPEGGPPLEVQITVDRDILQTFHSSGVQDRYDQNDRIIELKIPVKYADKSDEELEQLGLSELARIRATYLALTPIEGTKPGAGKPSNLQRRQRQRALPTE